MNDIVNAILLGIVEGLTEFLPVSSTAHLLLFQDLLGFQPPGAVFPIVIQFGAILSVVVVYWSKFWSVLLGLPSDASAQRFALGVIIAFLPSAVIGAALHGFIKDVLFAPVDRALCHRDDADRRRHPHPGLRAHRAAAALSRRRPRCRSPNASRSDCAR